jgi:FAD synthase
MTSSLETTESEMISSKLPIRLISTVIRGFGRGSSELGIATANLSKEDIGQQQFADLHTGIYYGVAAVSIKGGEPSTTYKAAISIGFNPTYGNKEKTVEPHLIGIAGSNERTKSSCGETLLPDFYEQQIKLSIIGFMRPELPYSGVEKLVEAIKNDIVVAERLCDFGEAGVKDEVEWCQSLVAVPQDSPLP